MIVVVAIANQGRDGGNRAEFIGHVRRELEARGAPHQLTDCVVRRLDAALNNKEIEKIYESQRGVLDGDAAVLASPRVKSSVQKSMIGCGLWLMRSGRLSKAELIRSLQGMTGRGRVSSQGRASAAVQ